MTTRPTVPTDWADAVGANRSTVPTAIRDLGVPPGDVFRSAYYNEALHDVGLWLGYLATASPSDRVWKIGRIVTGDDPLTARGLTITDEGGTAGGINVLVTQSGEFLQVGSNDGAGAIASTRYTRNAGIASARADGGWFWHADTAQRGVRALPDLTSLLVYEIQGGQNTTLSVGPNIGGYSVVTGATSGVVLSLAGLGDVAELYNTDASSHPGRARRPLDFVFSAPADGTTVRFRAVQLDAQNWTSTTGTTSVRLMYRAIGATGLGTALLTVTAASPSDDNGGTPIDLNPTDNVYWLEIFDSSIPATSAGDSVGDVLLVLSRFEA